MLVDYHMHLRDRAEGEREGHYSADRAERYVEQACATGVQEIGFTEHVFHFRQTEALWQIPWMLERCTDDLDEYVDAVAEAKRRGLPVKLGLEVDYFPGIERVTINSLRDETFYAVVRIVTGEAAQEIDSRPSDALNLAARVGAPIFVDEEVMARAGIVGDDLERELAEACEKYGWDLELAGEWRSLSPELVKALHPPPTAK